MSEKQGLAHSLRNKIDTVVFGTQEEAVLRFNSLVEDLTNEAIRTGDRYGKTFVDFRFYDRSQYFTFLTGEKKKYSWPAFHEWLKSERFECSFDTTGESVRISW